MLGPNAPVAAIMSVDKTNRGEPVSVHSVTGQETDITFADVLTSENLIDVAQLSDPVDLVPLQEDVPLTNGESDADTLLLDEVALPIGTVVQPDAEVEPDLALHIAQRQAGTGEVDQGDFPKPAQSLPSPNAHATLRIAANGAETMDAGQLGAQGKDIESAAIKSSNDAATKASATNFPLVEPKNAAPFEAKEIVSDGKTNAPSDARISPLSPNHGQNSAQLDHEFAAPNRAVQSQDAPKLRSIAELTYVSKQNSAGPNVQAIDLQKMAVAQVSETMAQPVLAEDGVEFTATLRTEIASVPTRADTTPQMARHVSQQVAYAIAQNTPGTTEIKLSPEELGRVRMTVQAAEGVVTISVVAERVETGDLMRRHAIMLEDALTNLGFETINLAFSNEGQQTRPDGGEPMPSAIDGPVDASIEQAEEIGPIGLNMDHAPRSGLDIRL